VNILIKHAWAGKTLTLIDIEKVLGKVLVNHINKKSWNQLLLWLKANTKTTSTFKLAHQIHTEQGITMYIYKYIFSIVNFYNKYYYYYYYYYYIHV
jgi:hypothetical protein